MGWKSLNNPCVLGPLTLYLLKRVLKGDILTQLTYSDCNPLENKNKGGYFTI